MKQPKAIHDLFLFEDDLFRNEAEIFRNGRYTGIGQNMPVPFQLRPQLVKRMSTRPRTRYRAGSSRATHAPVIILNWIGVDSGSNPLHPARVSVWVSEYKAPKNIRKCPYLITR